MAMCPPNPGQKVASVCCPSRQVAAAMEAADQHLLEQMEAEEAEATDELHKAPFFSRFFFSSSGVLCVIIIFAGRVVAAAVEASIGVHFLVGLVERWDWFGWKNRFWREVGSPAATFPLETIRGFGRT